MRLRLLGLISLLSMFSSAWAVPITFTYTGTGSGSLAGSVFTNVSFTIVGTGDTNNAQAFDFGNGFFINHTSAAINIAGLGVIDFLTTTRTFVNNDVGVVGFSRSGPSGSDLLSGPFSAHPDFFTWDMQSSIGPIAGTYGLLQWNLAPVNTSAGVLSFARTSFSGAFSASTISVPEPSTLAIFAFGILCIFAVRQRRIS